MKSKASLIVIKNGENKGKDITELVTSIQWSGHKGSPTRTLTFTLVDDDGFKHNRSGIDIERGYQCIYSWEGKELFRGIILKQSPCSSKVETFKAYDLGIYLSNNKDTFCYDNKTATDVFKDVCARFGIPIAYVAQTNYVIPDLTKKKTTGWDAIADALKLEYENTGKKYYVFSEKGKLYLKRREETIVKWVLDVNTNITKYKSSKILENAKTRIKLVSKSGTVLAEEKDEDIEKKIGIFQDIQTTDENLQSDQIKSLAKTLIKEAAKAERTLNLSNALGISDVISGVEVIVKIPHLNISNAFYVDSDSHAFKGNLHTMTLSLKYVDEPKTKEKENTNNDNKKYKTGDIVNFHGGCHYAASTTISPASSNLPAGKAKITYTSPSAPHPWHLVHTDSATTVYGWVDDGSFD